MKTVTAIRTAIAILALAALASCRTPATEIVLRVETDMDQGPGHTLTDVRVTVTSQGETTPHFDNTFQLGVAHSLPLLPGDLGITPRNDDGTRTVTIEVHAIGNGTELFTYRAIAPFETRHTGELLVFLADRCRLDANRMCLPDQTCGRYGCESVNHAHLPDFVADASTDTAAIDATDIGMDTQITDAPSDIASDLGSDAPPCGTGLILCNGSCVMDNDRHNCGTCGHDCTGRPNTVAGSGSCSAGVCQVTCAPNFADCDNRPDNGCETDLTTDANCGGCATACSTGLHCTMNAGGYGCASSCGSLTPTLCGTSCVNTNNDPDHCGNCTTACPPPSSNGNASCMMGVCGINCNPGYHACGAQCLPNNSPNSCGSLCTPCPTPANAIAACDGANCGFTCLAGWGNCDGLAANGCEQALNDASHCGSCTNVCSAGAPVCQPSGSTYGCVSTCTPGGACMPTSLCRYGVITCAGSVASCSPTTAYPSGSTCRGGVGVCDAAGNCNSCNAGMSCSTGNPCTIGSISCSSGSAMCVNAGNVNAGTPCTGGVCNGAGTCVPCNSGMPCNTGNPCVMGAISCTSGAPICVSTGNAPPSTPCGNGDAGGFCDGSGTCSMCTSGLSCSTGNPCTVGATMCPSGCTTTGPAPYGTPCAGGICNGSGTCTICGPMMGCMLNECTYGITACTGSGTTCQFSAYAPSGTSCTGGTCDGAGNCGTSCIPGSPCGGSPPECHTAGQTMCPLSCYFGNQPPGTPCMYTAGTCDGFGNCNTSPG